MKKFISLLLTIVLCFCSILFVSASDTLVRIPSTIPGTEIKYDYIENVTIQIPGTEMRFDLEGVAENVGVSYEDGKPAYRFVFYEGGAIKLYEDIAFLWSSQGGHISYPELWLWGDGAMREYQAGEVIRIANKNENNVYKMTRDIGEITRAMESLSTTIISESGEQIATVEFVLSGFGDGVYPYDWLSFDGVEIIDISNFLPYIVDSSLSIVEPSQTVIRYKDGIILHADVDETGKDVHVEWSADNDNFKMEKAEDDLSCKVISNSKGNTVVTATLFDDNGNIIGEDSIEMTSKAGFFDKIGGFFRSLFGLTRVYES